MPATIELVKSNLAVMESNVLVDQREHFDQQRRRWRFRFHKSNRLVTPSWIRATHYQCIYEAAPDLLKDGKVVWAFIVQANSDLYYAGPDDHPARLVFGIDDASNDLDPLKGYAEELLRLLKAAKSTSLPTFVDTIKSEKEPAFNKKLPSAITDHNKVCFTTTIIHRQFLPERKLQASWFPLLINPTVTDASIVLPSRYWLPAIKDAWKNYKDWAPQ